MDLGMRRIVLVIASIIGGVVGVFVILAFLNAIYGDISLERFGIGYAVLTALPLAVLVGIWLDFFLKTNLLADGPGEAPAKPARGGRAEE